MTGILAGGRSYEMGMKISWPAMLSVPFLDGLPLKPGTVGAIVADAVAVVMTVGLTVGIILVIELTAVAGESKVDGLD